MMFLEVLITLITRLRCNYGIAAAQQIEEECLYTKEEEIPTQFHILYDTTKMENVATIKMTKGEVKPNGKVSPASHVYNYFEVLRNCPSLQIGLLSSPFEQVLQSKCHSSSRKVPIWALISWVAKEREDAGAMP